MAGLFYNNLPPTREAEALAERISGYRSSNGKQTSCLIVIAFLKFVPWQRLWLRLSLYRQLKLFEWICVAVRILQHCINATTLLLYLPMLTIICGPSEGTSD